MVNRSRVPDPERPGLAGGPIPGRDGHPDWFDPKPEGPFHLIFFFKAIVFHLGSAFMVNIFKWVPECGGKELDFDGHSFGVVNANDKELWTFEFLHNFAKRGIFVLGLRDQGVGI